MAKPVAALALTLAALALPAGAAQAALIGTQPPRHADRAGLTRAFHRAHHGHAKVKLVGLRVYLESAHAGDAAAYYLTRGGPEGGYARGDFEYYHRVAGHRWRRVKALARSSEDNLHPAYLWRVGSTGSGSVTARTVLGPEEEDAGATSEIVERFSWRLRFGFKGRPFIFGYPGGDRAPPGLSGTVSYAAASDLEPANDLTCAGTLTDVGDDFGRPLVVGREVHRGRDYDIELDILSDEGLRYTWTSVERPHGGDAECGATGLLGSSLAAHARVPVRRFKDHVASFAVPVGGSSRGDGGGPEGTTAALGFSGRLSFTVMGIVLPHGLLGAPDNPDPEHG